MYRQGRRRGGTTSSRVLVLAVAVVVAVVVVVITRRRRILIISDFITCHDEFVCGGWGEGDGEGSVTPTDRQLCNKSKLPVVHDRGGGVCAVEWNAMVGWLVSGLRVFDAPGDDASSVRNNYSTTNVYNG